jgi:hypothetical protein
MFDNGKSLSVKSVPGDLTTPSWIVTRAPLGA